MVSNMSGAGDRPSLPSIQSLFGLSRNDELNVIRAPDDLPTTHPSKPAHFSHARGDPPFTSLADLHQSLPPTRDAYESQSRPYPSRPATAQVHRLSPPQSPSSSRASSSQAAHPSTSSSGSNSLPSRNPHPGRYREHRHQPSWSSSGIYPDSSHTPQSSVSSAYQPYDHGDKMDVDQAHGGSRPQVYHLAVEGNRARSLSETARSGPPDQRRSYTASRPPVGHVDTVQHPPSAPRMHVPQAPAPYLQADLGSEPGRRRHTISSRVPPPFMGPYAPAPSPLSPLARTQTLDRSPDPRMRPFSPLRPYASPSPAQPSAPVSPPRYHPPRPPPQSNSTAPYSFSVLRPSPSGSLTLTSSSLNASGTLKSPKEGESLQEYEPSSEPYSVDSCPSSPPGSSVSAAAQDNRNRVETANSSLSRYECPYCQKRFNRPSSLKIHVNTHTGEKPFLCTFPGCGRPFSVMSNMRRHSRVHAQPRLREENEIDAPRNASESPEGEGGPPSPPYSSDSASPPPYVDPPAHTAGANININAAVTGYHGPGYHPMAGPSHGPQRLDVDVDIDPPSGLMALSDAASTRGYSRRARDSRLDTPTASSTGKRSRSSSPEDRHRAWPSKPSRRR